MTTMNKNNAAATLETLDNLDREIEMAYNKACCDKSEQVNRSRLNKDEFKSYSAMANKRANEFSASVEELAKLKSTVLKKKVENLKNQVNPKPVEIKVEKKPAAPDEIQKAKNTGMIVGYLFGALTVGGLALYGAYKTKKRHDKEISRLYDRINELEKEKNQK